MATKMCFKVNENKVFDEEIVTFTYIMGMAFSQKCKNVLSFHTSIQQHFPEARLLEVSTKSYNPVGVALSAFNLTLDGRPIESIYHASKVFEDGSCFDFLKDYAPRDVKRYMREHPSGNLKCYMYDGVEIPLSTRTMFYDYIYIRALLQHPELSREIKDYDIFTDIEFNEKKGLNCQARACAIYSYMLRTNTVDKYMTSMAAFSSIYGLTDSGHA
jgi:type I restriction enzyme M protein